MDLRKLEFLEQFTHALSLRRRVLSRFGLGVGVSLLVLTMIFFNSPLKSSLLNPMFQGFYSLRANSSPVSSTASDLESSENLINQGWIKEKPRETNASATSKDAVIWDSDIKNETQVANFSQEEKNTTSVRERTGEKTNQENLKNASFLGNEEAMPDKNIKGKSLANDTKNSSIGQLDDLIGTHGGHTRPNSVGNLSVDGENGASLHREGRISEADHKDNLSQTGKIPSNSGHMKRVIGSSGRCDIFDGKWVRDNTMPYYHGGSCPYIDRDFNCHLNGRPDDEFLRWRWQPNGCDIPRLNATDFLERMRGKRLVFVGDSLNRNMWESLVCILRHDVLNKSRVYEISGKREFKKKGFYAFRFEDYNCSIDFVNAPFLVKVSSFRGKNGPFETLRLDLMDQTTMMYHEADILVFNTGHWWTHEKTSKGEDYYQEGNHVYPRLKVLEAYKKALTTWARWVEKNINAKRTQVFFRGYSVTHFRGGQWNSGGQCHKETEPIHNQKFLAKYPSKMKAVEQVLQEMRTPVVYLNISRLTDYRKDAHPSIYRKQYNTVEELTAAERSQDCSHWCLPGVPDTWNELLYASLLKTGRGSWNN